MVEVSNAYFVITNLRDFPWMDDFVVRRHNSAVDLESFCNFTKSFSSYLVQLSTFQKHVAQMEASRRSWPPKFMNLIIVPINLTSKMRRHAGSGPEAYD